MGGAIVSGCIIDRYETTAARQLVMVGGWAIVAVSYSMLGPLATLLHSHSAQVSLIAVGMFVQGIGSGGIIVPSLPNAQAGLVSEGEKAIVCSTWNSCYSGGVRERASNQRAPHASSSAGWHAVQCIEWRPRSHPVWTGGHRAHHCCRLHTHIWLRRHVRLLQRLGCRERNRSCKHRMRCIYHPS